MGLTGGEIPLEARIIAVADVFDALTSRRPYKSAWNNKEAFCISGPVGRNKARPGLRGSTAEWRRRD